MLFRSYCMKLHHIDHKMNEPEYFDRFKARRDCSDEDERFLIINSSKYECPLGLVALDEYCPLGDTEVETNSVADLEEKLAFARAVLMARLEDAERDA